MGFYVNPRGVSKDVWLQNNAVLSGPAPQWSDRPAENPQKAKAVPNPILPPLTQEPLLHLDATPDSDYPLRILRAYRENCNCRWIANPPSALCDAMNEAQEKRAKLLDRAIAILEKELGR